MVTRGIGSAGRKGSTEEKGRQLEQYQHREQNPQDPVTKKDHVKGTVSRDY
jgi:hypothetical protein